MSCLDALIIVCVDPFLIFFVLWDRQTTDSSIWLDVAEFVALMGMSGRDMFWFVVFVETVV